jgi:hypothetical protein
MPNSTVTIEANTGSTIINNLTVKTGSNVIIGEGVKVNKLIAQKVNHVYCKKQSSIEAEENKTGRELVIVEEDATSNTPDNTNRIYKGTPAWCEYVKILYAGVVGGTYKMESDARLVGQVDIKKTLNLDLNGHTMTVPTGAYFVLKGATGTEINLGKNGKIIGYGDQFITAMNGGSATINGGEIQMKSTTFEHRAILVDAGCALDIEGTKITADSCYAVVVAPTDETSSATLTVGKGTYISAKAFAISSNGTCQGDCIININGGEFVSKDYAMYLPTPKGVVTITDGKFTGKCGAIGIQRGSLTINGGEFISTGEVKHIIPSSGSGSNGLYDASLCVAARYGDVTVNITGGTFTAQNGAVAVSATYNNEEQKYTKNISVKNATFSDLTLLTAGNSDTYKVSGSFTLAKSTSAISADNLLIKGNKKVEVDLADNEVKLTHASGVRSIITLSGDDSKVTLKNGTITANGNEPDSNSFLLFVEKGNFELNNIELTTDWGTALGMQGDFTEGKIIDSKIKARIMGVSSNASTDANGSVYGYNAKMYLTNSKFWGADVTGTGFLNNVPATVYIKDCYFYGNCQSALLRGGTYEIENSTFEYNAYYSGNGTYGMTDNIIAGMKNNTTWGSGSCTAFAPLVIGNRTSGSYQYPTTVTFKGTKSTSKILTATENEKSKYPAQFPAVFIWGETGYPVTVKGDLTGFTANGYDYDAVIGGNVDVSGATLPSKVNDQREAASSSTTE